MIFDGEFDFAVRSTLTSSYAFGDRHRGRTSTNGAAQSECMQRVAGLAGRQGGARSRCAAFVVPFLLVFFFGQTKKRTNVKGLDHRLCLPRNDISQHGTQVISVS